MISTSSWPAAMSNSASRSVEIRGKSWEIIGVNGLKSGGYGWLLVVIVVVMIVVVTTMVMGGFTSAGSG